MDDEPDEKPPDELWWVPWHWTDGQWTVAILMGAPLILIAWDASIRLLSPHDEYLHGQFVEFCRFIGLK